MAKIILFYGVDATHRKMSNIEHLSKASTESKKVKISTIRTVYTSAKLVQK